MQVFLIPSDILCALELPSSSSRPLRFLRLPHPRTGVPSLFLPHSEAPSPLQSSNSLLEVQAVAPHSCRSWFLDEGRVVADGKLLVMTPIDPVFLLLPILQASQPVDGTVGNFRQADDIFEEAATRLSDASVDLKTALVTRSDVMELSNLDCVSNALRRTCDVKDLTDDLSVYRFSRTVLLETLRLKVARLSQPEMFGSFPSLHRRLARDGLLSEGKEDLLPAGRIRASCEILSQYLPPDIIADLVASYDFTALDAHIRIIMEEDNSHNPPPTRSVRVGKENDNKRKAASQLSKGVSKLMKANTSGMAKISTFFKKPTK